jgi:outer membrane protein OmpA-like peptidoglycan-associated protein
MKRRAVALLTAAMLSGAVVGAPPASAATFTVTSTDLCGGAGTFEQAVKDANANPGADTIEFTPGLTYIGINCYRTALDMPSPMVVTESVTVIGNGVVVDGGQIYLDPGGSVNPPNVCPTSGTLTEVARTAGFLAVGIFNQDNPGITATVRGFELKNLTSIATVYRNAALVLEDTTAHDIIDFNESCDRSLIDAYPGADVTIRNSRIFDSASPEPVSTTAMIGGGGGVVVGAAGDLILDRVVMGESTFPRVVRWEGRTVNIVSSQLLAGGGIYLDGATTEFVNSAFWSRKQGETERVTTRNGLTTARASSFYWTEPVGTGVEAGPGGAVSLNTSAVGARAGFTGASELLVGSDVGTFFSDANMSWVQPVGAQVPTAVLPDLLVGVGLPDDATSGELWTRSVTPIPGGVLVGAVPGAGSGGANELRSPIDNSIITVDVLGNPRVDGTLRDTGAVQSIAAPHLTVVSVGDGSVGLGWDKPGAPVGRTITGYTVGYRVSGQFVPLTEVAVSGAATVSTTVTGLTNGTTYQFIVWVNYDDASDGADSNSVTATPTSPSTPTSGPAPTSTPTPTPTTPVQQPLTPVVTPQTTAVAPGSTLVLVGGTVVPATSAPTAAGTGVQVSSTGWAMTVGGLQPNGTPAKLGAGNSLTVQTGTKVTATGTGFAPGTRANVYILDPAVTLGTCPVAADGSFACTLALPSTLAPGNHVLQVNGYTTDLLVRSVSMGLAVTANPTAVTKRLRTTVFFDVLSARLDAKARRDLAALARRVPKTATNVTVQVTGYVQPTSTTSNDTSLSTARARRVAVTLRADGVKGRYYVSGEGRSPVTGAKGRRVEVVVAYRLVR